MNRTFDFYEYAGIIIPGAVLILGLIWLFPEGRAIFAKEGVTFGELNAPPASMQFPVVREIYAVVSEAKRAARVDTFLGNYGLTRGLAATLLILIVVAMATTKGLVPVAALVVLFALALQRMHRYARHYATELFVQFLALKGKKAEPTV
jgi:hypothetical protein